MAEREIDVPRLLCLVEVDKAIDSTSPWWRRAYFQFFYRPFLRFSFNVFGVPTAGEIKADGSVTWLEKIGIFATIEEADKACLTEHYVITPMDFGDSLPEESIQHHGQIRPRASQPNRYNKLILSFTVKRASTICDEEAGIASAIARMDLLRDKLRTTVL